MDLINQFIENYKKKLTFYENLGRISSSQLEDALQSAGIRAMVTYRIKNPGRLKSKILRRNVKRTVPYKNMKEIYEDIADLCGIRVSLYFPGDRIKVDSLISDLFQVIERKQFPEQSKPPTYNKRFSGYWANHYRVHMKEEMVQPSEKRYCAARETTAAAPAETQAETAAQTTAEEKAQETTSGASSGSVSPEEFAKQEHGPIFEDIIKNGKLKVGIIGNNPTFCFHTVKDGKDELVGFEVEGMYEMAKRLSDYLGREVTVDFYESDFTGCMSALQANQVYFVTRLSPTDERKKTWLFTDVYHKSDECYVAKKDNENSDMFTGTLKGVKVAGQMGSIDITMTKYLYPDAEIQELDNTPNMLLAVKNGKADLACMNAVSAAMSVAANDDLVVVDKLTWEPTDEFDKGCGLCMAYGNEDFANWCNGFFSDIKAEGLWDQMQSDAAAELDAKALEDFIAQ